MATDIVSAGLAAAGKLGVRTIDLGAPAAAPSPQVEARFQASLDRAGVKPVGDVPEGVKGLFRALDGINVQARAVSDYAAKAEASGGQLTPGEIVQLTMQCQQFMFECQLTSNIANRSSDGVQQLFRQQG